MHKRQAVQPKGKYLASIASRVLALLIGYLTIHSGYTASAQAQDGRS